MKSEIVIDRLIRTRRRSVGLQIGEDGALVVRAPRFLSLPKIQKVVDDNERWIRNKRVEWEEKKKAAPPKRFAEGETFLYLGKPLPLTIVETGERPLRLSRGTFHLAREAQPSGREWFFRWYRERAEKILPKRVSRLSGAHGLPYRSVRISNARKRWGSCSAKGDIRISWRMIMVPFPVLDYLIVHELVHVRIRNHSRAYWDRVERIIPDWKEKRAWLNRHGHLLYV